MLQFLFAIVVSTLKTATQFFKTSNIRMKFMNTRAIIKIQTGLKYFNPNRDSIVVKNTSITRILIVFLQWKQKIILLEKKSKIL